jgi:hypothetical protein
VADLKAEPRRQAVPKFLPGQCLAWPGTWLHLIWIFWVATMMLPREETRRYLS